MSADEQEILRRVALQGRVHPDTFKGRGMIVAKLVKYGFLEWERKRAPDSLIATALVITEEGRFAISSSDQGDK